MRQKRNSLIARSSYVVGVLSVLLIQTACGPGGGVQGPFEVTRYTHPNNNAAPTVDAGPDQHVLAGDSVTLFGSAHDDVWIDRLEWRQPSEPKVGVAGATISQPTFVAPAVAEHTELKFVLRAFDDQGKVGSDETSVFVDPLQQTASLVPPDTYTLNFESLPSAQGWTFVDGALAEDNVFSVEVDRMVQQTIGSGSLASALYQLDGVADPNKRMVLSVTARVLGYENLTGGSTGQAFNFFINDGEYSHRLALTDDLVQVGGQFYGLKTTDVRNYRLELEPGGSFKLYVDGIVVAIGVGSESASGNEVFFGDSTVHENSNAEVFALSFVVGPQPAYLGP